MLQLSYGGCHSLQPSAAKVGDGYPEINHCCRTALLLYLRNMMEMEMYVSLEMYA